MMPHDVSGRPLVAYNIVSICVFLPTRCQRLHSDKAIRSSRVPASNVSNLSPLTHKVEIMNEPLSSIVLYKS